jgi:hypothetical protein
MRGVPIKENPDDPGARTTAGKPRAALWRSARGDEKGRDRSRLRVW